MISISICERIEKKSNVLKNDNRNTTLIFFSNLMLFNLRL